MGDIEYIISGTVDELERVLVNDFKIPSEEARLIIYLYTLEKKDKMIVRERELELWFLHKETPNTGHLFNTPYTISITELKLNSLHTIYTFLGTLILTKKIGYVNLSLSLIWLVKESLYKIKATDFCVYARIIDYVYGENKEYFKIQDIIPYDMEINEHICNRKPAGDMCVNLNNERDTCYLNENRIKTILDEFVENHILLKANEYWRLAK